MTRRLLCNPYNIVTHSCTDRTRSYSTSALHKSFYWLSYNFRWLVKQLNCRPAVSLWLNAPGSPCLSVVKYTGGSALLPIRRCYGKTLLTNLEFIARTWQLSLRVARRSTQQSGFPLITAVTHRKHAVETSERVLILSQRDAVDLSYSSVIWNQLPWLSYTDSDLFVIDVAANKT